MGDSSVESEQKNGSLVEKEKAIYRDQLRRQGQLEKQKHCDGFGINFNQKHNSILDYN